MSFKNHLLCASTASGNLEGQLFREGLAFTGPAFWWSRTASLSTWYLEEHPGRGIWGSEFQADRGASASAKAI